jgi:uncharacterized protein (UPF0261 family)
MAQGAKGAPMSERKGIVIVCNLDTRGEEIVFVKDLIAGRGHEAILLDFSMEEPPRLSIPHRRGGAWQSIDVCARSTAATATPPRRTRSAARPPSSPTW